LTDFAVRSPSQAIQPAQDTGKILGIELLRFTSALAVLIFHYQHFTFVGASPVDLIRTQQPFYPVLGFFYRYGFYGVEVFWCISGFIFFWKYAREIAGRTLAGYTFFILRVSRLYPLHLATLLFVAVMQWVYRSKNGAFFVYQVNDLQHFVLQLFMASNWGPETAESFNGPIWSISIEVLVYAIFFMSLRYLSSSAIFITLVAVGAGLIQLLKLSENPLFTCLMYFYLGCLTGKAAAHGAPASERARTAIDHRLGRPQPLCQRLRQAAAGGVLTGPDIPVRNAHSGGQDQCQAAGSRRQYHLLKLLVACPDPAHSSHILRLCGLQNSLL
jgi:peptidoglycan/LPS O-acetylase OafA/YrhL